MNWKLFTYTSFPESSTTIVIQRVSAALGVFLMTVALAACVGSVKPVPTQESQDAPPTKTAEALKPAEPVPAAPPPSEPDAPVLPLPPVSKSQPDTTSTQEEIPVVEAKPVMVTGQRQSYTAD
ncbi:MAG: hypothetical protein WA045_08520 [Nitrospira sp.]